MYYNRPVLEQYSPTPQPALDSSLTVLTPEHKFTQQTSTKCNDFKHILVVLVFKLESTTNGLKVEA